MATLIKVDGSQKDVFPADKENGFTLKELYGLLECGMIEIAIIFQDGKILVVDEEGFLKPDPVVNPVASMLAGHYIVGNAIVVSQEEFQ